MSKTRLRLLPPGVGKKPMFNERPITLDGWRLEHRRAVPIGKPTIEQTEFALSFSNESNDSSSYWIADILAHAESRADWGEAASQIMDETGKKRQTLYNLSSMAARVDQEERDLSPSVAHSMLVAKLPKNEQRRWLKKATAEGWGKRELDLELKANAKRTVAKGSADLEGMFRVWYVDYPWKYKTTQPSGTSAQTHYKGLDIEKGIKMGDAVRAHTTKHAVGFFWVTAPMLYYASDGITPDPFRLMQAWGFEPKTGKVWDKVMHNFGHYGSVRHEHLIIATRGSCTPDHPNQEADSVITIRRSDTHSEKPHEFRQMIEKLYDGPRVEMFARSQHRGWTAWGDQINSPLAKAAG